ncbi:unnamed protein product [Cuscuta campestris]|uniref:Uncharacterized protein n=1 Tax=Cuscuta campestris TaxID=132261 RepID=A0A484L2N2_9ASTE|nr:unnamed protein product [Cuscuta campestris]
MFDGSHDEGMDNGTSQTTIWSFDQMVLHEGASDEKKRWALNYFDIIRQPLERRNFGHIYYARESRG